VSEWLSAEWFDETRDLRRALPPLGDLSARLQVDVTGGPERLVTCHWVLDGGRVVDCGPGGLEDPDVVLTLSWDDALAVHRGDLDPNVAFMQGRLKVAGSMGVMVELLPALRRPEWQEARRRAAATTQG